MSSSHSRNRQKLFDLNRNTSPDEMFKTPPKNPAEEAANPANANEAAGQRFGSINDISRTINVKKRAEILRVEQLGQSRSVEALNAQLDDNAVGYELPRPKDTGAIPKRQIFADLTVPPPKVGERRARGAPEISEELQSFIRLSISESQNKTKEQLSFDIANAVQAAFEQNIDRIVSRIRSEVSASPSGSAGSYNMMLKNPTERASNARPSREMISQPPPAYEGPNQVHSRQDNHEMSQPMQLLLSPNNMPPPTNLNVDIRPENESRNRNINVPREVLEARQSYASARVHTKVYEWGLSYEGSRGSTTVEDFIFRVEFLQNHYRCPWSEVLRDFHRLLKGEAIEWYWISLKSNPVTTWPQLKQNLLRQFRNTKSDFELMRNLVERRQNPGESIDEYFLAMTKLRSMLRVDMDNQDLIRIIKRNVRDNVSRMIYPMQIWSVEHLREECKQAEEHLARNFQRNAAGPNVRPYNSRGQVQSVYLDEEVEEGPENIKCIEEVQGKARSKDECFKCHKLGHRHKDCPQALKKIYCFRCGKEDVIAPKCPECLAKGNERRNAALVGEQRSKEISVEK